ncbi:TIGR03619 family F420-dependent LLM class oxidoreductase [Streptomyces sp. BHT-5-2]|uniref:TIGR03619 family F420-dependent LLM class oxidoreductase n=1 Tax=Streptomyces sp. BHT-5-2 TaxID=2866715 RepID=UPI001C8E058C|nr:TIGR03619 family F420-dependent LLM class oxidoreductase [Streptomyces sp. BHT-5-2]QZL06413.1 TIGR03619 family F420-dependent LLM class oxidoreductase [Streptomyces sp. BHT-5-2]
MRIGLALPQYGPFADALHLTRLACAAERAGFDSLWVGDRALVPVEPRSLYSTPEGPGPIPREYRAFLDPVSVLGAVAAVTERVRLGTNVLVAPWYPPVLLARTLASVDRLSGGRLDVGLGLGWSRDEYQAIGVPYEGRGERVEEVLDVLDALWAEDGPAQHKGRLWSVPPSHVELGPVQRPRPPVYLAAFHPSALARVGRRADGWLPADLPVPVLGHMWSAVRRAAAEAGRDPEALRMVLRTNPVLGPASAPRHPAGNTVESVAAYLRAGAEAGAEEALIDLQMTVRSPEEFLDVAGSLLDRLRAD